MMSFVRAGLYGLVSFLALTASLALAFSFAIAGPPTNEEMLNLGRAARVGLERAGAAAERLAQHFCEESDLCGARQSEQANAAPAQTQVISAIDPPPSPVVEVAPIAASLSETPVADLALLGGHENATPAVRIAPVRVEPPRRIRPPTPPRRRAVRAPPPPPITVEPRPAIEQLAERVEELLTQTPAAHEAELGPSQNEQDPQSEPYDDPDEGWWEEDEDWREEEPPPEASYWRSAY